MPRFHRNNQRNSSRNQNQNPTQNQNRNAEQPQGQPFPAQDNVNSIPFYNARLFAMYESLIQSYTHFTYHANHMYGVLEQALHGTRNSINSNPYPWLVIPHPNYPTQGQTPYQSQQSQGQQSQFHPTQGHQSQQQGQQSQGPTRSATNTNTRSASNATTNAANATTRSAANTRATATTALENNIINALFGLISQPLPEEQRLTQAQLDERIQYVEFRNIVNPINSVCSITHDAFEPTQRVARIRHCGHIFNSDSLTHWLRINNTCPTCRHNLLTSSTATGSTATSDSTAPITSAPPPTISTSSVPTGRVRRVQIPLESDININTFYNELLRNSGNIPGFELNGVDDNSVVFSFDLMSRLNGTSGPTSGPNPTSGTRGPGPIDDVD